MTIPPGLPDQIPSGSRVLLRADLNVPIESGRVTSDERIRASADTIQHLQQAGCRVLVMSHLGRPQPGSHDASASLEPVGEVLAECLGTPVAFQRDWLDGVDCEPGQVTLLENVRFLEGETDNSPELGKRMAALCDLYVMDAFGCAHRAHASTHAVAQYAPRACVGPLLQRELEMLGQALDEPTRPLVAIVGGAKVSTKIQVLERLAEITDQLILGGGIANTFLAAEGSPIGDSLHEPEQLDFARGLIKSGAEIPLPLDVICLPPNSDAPVAREYDEVRPGERIMDMGLKTLFRYTGIIMRAGTVIWNGPLGVFEDERFERGTKVMAQAVSGSPAFSIAGGGDTLAAVNQFGVRDKISYLSTGGGAFLEYAAGHPLPAVEVLDTVTA